MPSTALRKAAPVIITLLLGLLPGLAAAQFGQVSGTVTHGDSGEPVGSVQISIAGTQLGTISGADGAFTVTNVPAGTHDVVAQRLGFQQLRTADVTVTEGESTTLNLTMNPTVLALQGIVATGLVDPVEGVRSPISVGRIDREQVPIHVAGDALQQIQGRIAGASVAKTSGRSPGGTAIVLRSLTSLSGNNTPLIVIDGVIVGYVTLSNIEPADVESVEVVRGAAAASLYGSRANAGVVNIRTYRGNHLEMGRTEISARSEYGYWTITRLPDYPIRHQFLVNDASNPTAYVDLQGAEVPRAQRVSPAPHRAFMDKAYPTPIYDNVANSFTAGAYKLNQFTVSRNSPDTNFSSAFTRAVEDGAMRSNDGYRRLTFRTNLDHRFELPLSMSVSFSHLREDRDETTGGGAGGASAFSFANLYRAPPDVDLTQVDENGKFLRIVDPDLPFVNPLWAEQSASENKLFRMRTTGAVTLQWEPFSWLGFQALGGYDRSDLYSRFYTPMGTPLDLSGTVEADGHFSRYNSVSDSWYTEVQSQLRGDFGGLNARTTGRFLMESDEDILWNAIGNGFLVGGVPSVVAIPVTGRSSNTTNSFGRAMGVIWDNSFAYEDRYIGSILFRWDGSSAFGADNRWSTFYRTAFAWRIAQEDWFDVRGVDELKLAFARGTAGARPGRNDQFELWTIGAAGLGKNVLGNNDLRPEHTLEQEVSLSAIFNGRYSVELTHSWQVTDDQIVSVPVPAFTGYNSQVRNGGEVRGHSTELTIEAQLLTTSRFQWHSMVVGDRSRGEISFWPYPCTTPTFGTSRCTGVQMQSIWGNLLATDLAQLTQSQRFVAGSSVPEACHHGCAAASRASEFALNDEGYVVWVGPGNQYTDGIAKDLWGTTTNIDGVVYQWGTPFSIRDDSGAPVYTQIGDANYVNLGWINNFSFGQLTLHGHLHAKIGGQAINNESRLAVASFRSYHQDQGGKSEGLKKPISYYNAVAGGAGGMYFMEDNSFLKLRTLSAQYRLSESQLSRFGLSAIGVRTASIGLIGRDILTFTPYRGQDPEVAMSVTGGAQTESATYPTYASYTIEFGLTF